MAEISRMTYSTQQRIHPTFEFKPFSERQKKVLMWWNDNSAYADYDGIIADGSVRSGKSMCMSLSFVLWAMYTFDQRNFAICGKTISSIQRNVITDLKRMLITLGYQVTDRRSEHMLIITYEGRTNYFYTFGGTDERSQDLIQGITLAGVLLDEVALMPESFANQATARCSVTGSKLWFNCNPAGSRLHWFKAKWINDYKHKRLLYLHFTMDDNLTLADSVKQRFEQMYTGVFYRRYIEGRWVAAEGVIYDMWSDELNTYTFDDMPFDYERRYRRYIAIDYGTANPMVYLDVFDGDNGFFIRREYYYDGRASQASKTDEDYADDFERFVNYDHAVTAIIDPSALSFRMVLRNRGYRVKEADNDVMDGIRITSTLIKQRRIKVVAADCPNFLREISSYVWDEKSILNGDEKPLKVNDHCMDAMRYLCKTLINRRRLMANE